MRKRFKIKNLIRNKFQRNIFLNDALASGSAMVSENISLKHILLSKGEGGRSPLLHTGYPRKRNGHRHVMLNLFQHLANVEFHGYSKRLPQGRNIGQTLNQVVSDYSGLHSQSTPLYFAFAKWSRRLAVCSYGLGSLRSRGALPKILQGDVKSHSDLIK